VKQKPLNDLIFAGGNPNQVDPHGSLIDADMTAYYTWLEVANLPGANKAVFLAWFPAHRRAFLIGPGVPRGVSASSPLTIRELLALPVA
jgi:hypothetical protein